MFINQTELDQPCWDSRTRNLGKGRGRTDVHRRRSGENLMVEHVEDVRAKQERVTFPNLESLD